MFDNNTDNATTNSASTPARFMRWENWDEEKANVARISPIIAELPITYDGPLTDGLVFVDTVHGGKILFVASAITHNGTVVDTDLDDAYRRRDASIRGTVITSDNDSYQPGGYDLTVPESDMRRSIIVPADRLGGQWHRARVADTLAPAPGIVTADDARDAVANLPERRAFKALPRTETVTEELLRLQAADSGLAQWPVTVGGLITSGLVVELPNEDGSTETVVVIDSVPFNTGRVVDDAYLPGENNKVRQNNATYKAKLVAHTTADGHVTTAADWAVGHDDAYVGGCTTGTVLGNVTLVPEENLRRGLVIDLDPASFA